MTYTLTVPRQEAHLEQEHAHLLPVGIRFEDKLTVLCSSVLLVLAEGVHQSEVGRYLWELGMPPLMMQEEGLTIGPVPSLPLPYVRCLLSRSCRC